MRWSSLEKGGGWHRCNNKEQDTKKKKMCQCIHHELIVINLCNELHVFKDDEKIL